MFYLASVQLWLFLQNSFLGSALTEPTDVSAVPAHQLLQQMQTSWEQVQTATYCLYKTEQFLNEKTIPEQVLVKFRKPMDVYLAAQKPKIGQEVIYSLKNRPAQLVVHPGHFPDFTLWLDIHGHLVTRRQHHLITQSGFGYILEQIGLGLKHVGKQHIFEQQEPSLLWGRLVQKVTFTPLNNQPQQVQPAKNMALLDFAKEQEADAFWLVYLNPDLLDGLWSKVSAHKQYQVPITYGQRVVLWVDDQTHLPIQIEAYDFQGRLYEHFEYRDLVINPILTDADFDPDNPAYKF